MKPSQCIETVIRSSCPVACVLDLLGDKWTLIVVRDMFLGKHTYSELQQGRENIPTNILADRLKRLERSDIVEKRQYQQRPARYSYHLTKKGEDLGPVLQAMFKWGEQHLSYAKSQADPEMLKQIFHQP